MENQLYDATARLLNTKKRKCLELAEEVQDLKEELENLKSKGKGPAKGKLSVKKAVQETTYSDDTDVDTDQEMVSMESEVPQEKSALRSNSQSLMLDDGDNTVIKTTVNRRTRRGNVKRTPSKPVLPSSLSQKKSNSSTTRLRKKSSTASNNSENLDYDNLVDNM